MNQFKSTPFSYQSSLNDARIAYFKAQGQIERLNEFDAGFLAAWTLLIPPMWQSSPEDLSQLPHGGESEWP